MVDYDKILGDFKTLVGFYREPGVDIQESLHNSVSGVYFQEAHPLITLRSMAEIAPKTTDRLYEIAKIGESYPAGKVLSFLDDLYEVKKDTTLIAPFEDNVDLEQTNLLSQWLKLKTIGTIKNVVAEVMQRSIITKKGREVLDTNLTLYNSTFKDYVGQDEMSIIRISLKPNNGISVRIAEIRAPDYPIYVFKKTNNLSGPVLITTINNPHSVPVVLSRDDAGDLFSEFYLVYKQPKTEVFKSGSVIRETPYFTVETFKMNSADFDDSLDSVELHMVEADHPYGLDFSYAAVCDYTELFIKNKYDFVNLIKLQFAVNMLKEFIYNPNARVNRTSMIASRAEILYALDGENSKFARNTGLSKDLQDAYTAFELNTRGYNSRCLPCTKKGVAYRTIG